MRITEPYIIFPRKLKSGRIVYYYQYRKEDGTQSNALSTGCNTSAKAKRIVQHLYITGQLKSVSSETFSKFADGFFDDDSEFVEWRKLSGNPILENSLKGYKSILCYRLMPFFENYKISDISVDVVKKWILWASQKWSPKSVNNSQNVLSIILNSAVEKQIINKNPVAKIGTRKVEKKIRELLEVEEIKKLYKCNWSNASIKKVFITLVITGMRLGEVLALRNEDVNNNYLDVKHSWRKQFGLTPTKTKQNRKVPIPNDFISQSKISDWIFKRPDIDEPVTHKAVYSDFLKNCELLGIKTKERNLTLHTLRNFFISYMKGKNVPELKIKATVGHTDSSITDWYTYWKPDMLKEVYIEQEKLFHEIVD